MTSSRWVRRLILVLTCSAVLGSPLYAQTGTKQEAMNIINNLPPDLFAKVQALAQMLDQSIKAGKLTEAEVQQNMLSGRLSDKLKTINPEAGYLLDEIGDAMKAGKGPDEQSLLPLLGGLGISP